MTATAVHSSPIQILLVEDNPGDVVLTITALKDSKVLNQISVAEDGEKALAFLRKEGPYQDSPRPDLILLDLNLGRLNGREVLETIKGDPALKRIPVVILTSSQCEEDILNSYNHQANCFITKPIELGQFMKVLGAIGDFWLSVVKLP